MTAAQLSLTPPGMLGARLLLRLAGLTSVDGDSARGACFSHDRRHRYLLWRIWDESKPIVGVLGINPSFAGVEDDHTTRKLIGFGQRLGWGGYLLGNPFAFVSTDQLGLLRATDPVGPENDALLALLFAETAFVVCAWGGAKSAGVRKLLNARLHEQRSLFINRALWCFGVGKTGAPNHPLMLSYSTPLVRWRAA